ncbi:uncharacterized protein LOC117177920 [Belonocnema kinseyi]|uniref:uncharacterized protein LOC117177920 n=1 Tax=Belonocnema kinseyi TaxID=2817044 RepID=UPI00143CCE11|nr:uncharacterized protein LOC117177920 [Belonocnema kinseyi]XP_033224917.1 uncharacterized protein LOC117177920 [Belonocnema kinseyi]
MELTREHFRAMIFYDFRSNLSVEECSQRLISAFGDEAPSKKTIYWCFNEFTFGRTSLGDEFRDGRPSTTVFPANIDALQEMIEMNRHVTYVKTQSSLDIDNENQPDTATFETINPYVSKNPAEETNSSHNKDSTKNNLPRVKGSADKNLLETINKSKTKKTSLKATNRKCPNLEAEKKLEVLKKLDQGISTAAISSQYGIDPSTVRKWIKKRRIIEKCNEKGGKTKRLRENPNEKMNEALYMWFQYMRESGLPVSGRILKKKALELYGEIGGSIKFCASEGWLSRWKGRYGVRLLPASDEKVSTDKKTQEEFNLEIVKCESIESEIKVEII